MDRQVAGDLGLTNFEKFITVVCWWQPMVALISLFFGSAPGQLRRHAKWSVLTVVAVIALAVILGLVFAGVGYLVAGGEGAAVGAWIAGISGLFQFLAALFNTIAVIANRGPYFTSAGTGARLR